MSLMDVLNGVASVLCIVGFVLDCAERFAMRRERHKDGRR